MVSRALSLAAVTLLVGGLRPEPALSQAQNLEAGKSPSQIFAGTCTACHKGPRGLLKTVPAGSLPGFLRQHYTTSPEMASLLAGFLVSNGAADTRYAQPKAGRDDKSDARLGGAPDQLDRFGRRMRAAPQQQADPREPATPETAAVPDSPRLGRNERRFARPSDAPGAEGTDIERGPDGRRLPAKQKLSRRGKPGGEEPKTDVANPDPAKQKAAKSDAAQGELPKTEAIKSETPGNETPQNEVAKNEAVNSSSGKPEPSRLPAGDAKSEPTKLEASKDTSNSDVAAVRSDPVAPIAPAAAVSAAVPSGTPDQPAVLSTPPSPRAVTAAVPAPVAPAGPPAPPISR